MNCRKCDASLRAGQRHCASCGAQVDKTCPACRALAAGDARFCAMCGAAFAEGAAATPASAPGAAMSARQTDGERRQLTVLFADVVGSTALASVLDPEALRDVLLAYQRVCSESVIRFGGNINQYIGDGVVAFFGYPVAHENDAERAVLAGLAIIAAVRKLDATLKSEGAAGIEARVGIHTGLVVVGAMTAGGGNIDHAVGETPHLAARIQGEAAPNSVCISAATLELVRDRFQVRALGVRAMKGVAADTAIHAVDAALVAAPNMRTGRQATPLIGRELELSLLLERWATAQRGQGQAVLLSGEGGIGKSRLLSALRSHVAVEGNAWRTIHCSPFYQNSALHPIIDLIDRAIDSTIPGPVEDTPTADRGEALRNVLHSAGVGDDTTYALVSLLLGMESEQQHLINDLSPAQRKRHTLDALIAWLHADARRHPLVVVVEDLHWVDASTRELLGLLLERILELPVLVVLTFRPEFVPTWKMHGQISMISLARLSRPEIVSVSLGITGGKALPASLLDEIVRRTDGVPLFVEEITKAVLASTTLVDHEGELQLAGGHASLPEVPTTLRDSLTARLDRLGDAKAVAQLASVLGREFDYKVLQAVCDMPGDELDLQLATLNRADIIQQSGVPPLSHYVFKHALLQEAAYDTLLRSVRPRHHQRAARAYVQYFPDVVQSRPELVAYHYSRASMAADAVPFWRQAGELAVARSGYEEAIAHLDEALAQVQLVPNSAARAATELGLRVTIGPALIAGKGMGAPETGSNYARACELAETLGEPDEQFAAMWGDWLHKNTKGQLLEASRRSEDLVLLSRKLADDGFALQAHHSRWTNFFYLGQIDVARADTLHGIEHYDRETHRNHKHLYGGHDPGVCAHNFGALAAWATGHAQEGCSLARDAIALAQGLDHLFTLSTAYLHAMQLHHCLGDPAAARRDAEHVITLCEKHGFPQWTGAAYVFGGATRVALDGSTVELRMVEEGLKHHRAKGQAGGTLIVLAVAAEAYLAEGNSSRALELLAEGVDFAERSHVGWFLPEVLRVQAAALRLSGRGNLDDTLARLGRAASIARRQGAATLEWRAGIALARLLAGAGKIEAARKHLVTICDNAGTGLDAPELDQARDLLAAL